MFSRDKGLVAIVAAIITGTSGKPPQAAVTVAIALVEEVEKRFPECKECGAELQPDVPCKRCARQAELAANNPAAQS